MSHVSHNALVLCRQAACRKVLSKAFADAAMDHDVCDSANDMMERMVRARYSALLLDFDLPRAAQVAVLARMTAAQHRPVMFALLGPDISVGAAFQAGANYVLYKPLELEPVEQALRAAKAFMKADRRRAVRQKTEVLVYLRCGIVSMPALAMDLSEQGLTLQAAEPLPPLREMPLRFVLPGGTRMIEATGEVIWSDEDGRAGLFFTDLSIASRRQLKQWLRKHGTKSKNAVSVLLQPFRPRARRAATH